MRDKAVDRLAVRVPRAGSGLSARLSVEAWCEVPRSERLYARHVERYLRIRQFFRGLLDDAERAGELRADLDKDALAALLLAHRAAGVQLVPLLALKAAYTVVLNHTLSPCAPEGAANPTDRHRHAARSICHPL